MGLVWGIYRVKWGLVRVFDRWGLGIKGTMGNSPNGTQMGIRIRTFSGQWEWHSASLEKEHKKRGIEDIP